MSQPHDGELLIAMLAVVELESSNATPIANGNEYGGDTSGEGGCAI